LCGDRRDGVDRAFDSARATENSLILKIETNAGSAGMKAYATSERRRSRRMRGLTVYAVWLVACLLLSLPSVFSR
jgi:hypothetical protein